MNEDEQAVVFRQWFGQYTALMARLARAYTATPEDCEDLLQEILFEVWRSIPRFEHKARPSTWIYRVALNTALAWQRKGRQQRRFRPLLETADAPQDNREQVHDQERIDRLYVAIRQLPKADAALVLLYLEDLSYREMAEVLGISEINVGVKLSHARKVLAELMGGGAMDPDELKRVWQSQGTGRRLTVDADVLLPIFRRSQRHFRLMIFLSEGFIMIALVIYAAMSVGFGLLILRKPVPVLALGGCFSFACVCLAVAGYKAWDRFHQMQRRATASDPIRACLEEHLDWLRHETRLWTKVLWWLMLPLAIGILVCAFSLAWAAAGLEGLLCGPSLTVVSMCLGIVWGGTWFCRWYVRKRYEPRQRELESLLQDLQSD